MSLKWLKGNESDRVQSVQNDGPRPGDFELGSRASRAAARALLEAKKSGKQNTSRLVIDCVGKRSLWEDGKPSGSICKRSFGDDGQVHEFVDLTHSDLSEKELNKLIRHVPVDGEIYRLEDFRTNAGASPNIAREILR